VFHVAIVVKLPSYSSFNVPGLCPTLETGANMKVCAVFGRMMANSRILQTHAGPHCIHIYKRWGRRTTCGKVKTKSL